MLVATYPGRLPDPRGHRQVSVREVEIEVGAPGNPAAGTGRRFWCRVYLPTDAQNVGRGPHGSARRAGWLPEPADVYMAAMGDTLGLSKALSCRLLGGLLGVTVAASPSPPHTDDPPTHATAPIDAPTPAASAAPSLPVSTPLIVFCHGLRGSRATYSSSCVELASAGAVVVVQWLHTLRNIVFGPQLTHLSAMQTMAWRAHLSAVCHACVRRALIGAHAHMHAVLIW